MPERHARSQSRCVCKRERCAPHTHRQRVVVLVDRLHHDSIGRTVGEHVGANVDLGIDDVAFDRDIDDGEHVAVIAPVVSKELPS